MAPTARNLTSRPECGEADPLAVLHPGAYAVTMLLLLLACVTEEAVDRAIDEANYCEQVSDCVSLGSHCPFDCYVLVNAAEADRIESLIERYEAQQTWECMYDCIAIDGFACSDGTCITIPASDG